MAEFKPITDEEFAQRAVKHRGPVAISAKYDSRAHGVAVTLSNGVAATFPLDLLPGLEQATPADLRKIVVEGGGYGFHVPALDADISVAQLFADHLGSTLMLKGLNRTRASRSNGRLGGRPRKIEAA